MKDQSNVCQTLLSINPAVIYASILSMTGEEIGSASKPSLGVLIPSNSELKNHFRAFSSILTAYRNEKSALSGAERMFGKFKDLVVTFANFKVIIILDDIKQQVVALATMKDADSKKITFQSTRIISG